MISVKNIFPKIGGRLRLSHEANEQRFITTEIIKYDENLAGVRAITAAMKGNFPGLGMASIEREKRYFSWHGNAFFIKSVLSWEGKNAVRNLWCPNRYGR